MFRFALAALFAAGLALPAAAQPVCGKRADMIEQLSAKYAEAPTAMGLSSEGGVIEILTSPDGTTWTILGTEPPGLSCLVASGEAWQTVTKVNLGSGI